MERTAAAWVLAAASKGGRRRGNASDVADLPSFRSSKKAQIFRRSCTIAYWKRWSSEKRRKALQPVQVATRKLARSMKQLGKSGRSKIRKQVKPWKRPKNVLRRWRLKIWWKSRRIASALPGRAALAAAEQSSSAIALAK